MDGWAEVDFYRGKKRFLIGKVPSEARGSNHIGVWFRGIYKIP